MSLSKIKSLFPIFSEKKEMVFFDNAATTHKPQVVIDAIGDFYSKEYATVHRGVYGDANNATNLLEESRKDVAEFIGAESCEVIFTHSATESLNLIAQTYGNENVCEGDEILISEAEHHSNFLPWTLLCKRKNARLMTFKITPDGHFDLDDFRSKLSDKTKIVSVAHMSNVLGIENPVAEMAKQVKKAGAVFVVDGAQMVAHGKVDVKALGADFYAFSGHKMYGPTGVGVLYGQYDLLEKMPPFHGGGSMVEKVTEEDIIYRDPPHRFEAGTLMIASIIGLKAAIKFMREIGFDEITKREKLVSLALYDALKDHVDFIIPQKGGSILTFIPKDMHPIDFTMMLACDNICLRVGNLCAQPLVNSHFGGDVCRISVGIYNDIEDVKALKKALIDLKATT